MTDEYQNGIKLPTNDDLHNIETVKEWPNAVLERIRVPGGWLYMIVYRTSKVITTTFVPEPEKCQYHNEYRMQVCQACLNERG